MHAYPHVPDFPPSCFVYPLRLPALSHPSTKKRMRERGGGVRACTRTGCAVYFCLVANRRRDNRAGRSSVRVTSRRFDPWRISKFRNSVSNEFPLRLILLLEASIFFFLPYFKLFSINIHSIYIYTWNTKIVRVTSRIDQSCWRILKFRNSLLQKLRGSFTSNFIIGSSDSFYFKHFSINGIHTWNTKVVFYYKE